MTVGSRAKDAAGDSDRDEDGAEREGHRTDDQNRHEPRLQGGLGLGEVGSGLMGRDDSELHAGEYGVQGAPDSPSPTALAEPSPRSRRCPRTATNPTATAPKASAAATWESPTA